MKAASMILFPCLLLAVTAFFLWTRLLPQQRTIETVETHDEDVWYREGWPADESCPPFLEPSRFRAQFSLGGGAIVKGWPSKGGIYVKGCTVVELDFLGLDRFHNTERPSESDADANANEEEHCNKMRHLGAKWWPTEEDQVIFGMGYPDWDGPFIQVGWPVSGGVWVLKSTVREAHNRGAGRIHNARNMEERCQIIEEDGGVFYADPKDCPHLDLP